jgi:predicted RNase H-like nuclease (RuvC/YqgF family)
MNPSNTTELITQIISNPIFANDIYNYINNIKPKLDNITTKKAILDEIYNKLNEQPNVQITEYKELLKKFRNKYDKLKEEYTKKNSAIDALKTELNEIKNKMNDYSNKEIMIDSLKKEISQLKLVCADKDNINGNLISRIEKHLSPLNIEISIPDPSIIAYKEALVMALLGVLRWREEETVFGSVTGARRASVGGALWMGQS